LKDLPISIAACLTAHSLNVGYRPIAKKGVEPLERSRLSHVYQNYFRPETLSLANVPLVEMQANLPLAQAWGGGLVAAGRRDAVRRSGPGRVRPSQQEVLWIETWYDLAERHERPGHGTRREGRVGDDALDPICLKVFEEKISGKLATGDRPALLNALSHIRDGDLLTVQEVDRLGRNLLEGLIVSAVALSPITCGTAWRVEHLVEAGPRAAWIRCSGLSQATTPVAPAT
jgi:hypothetical protein